jgi:DNA polymerase-3 subunit chi
MAEAYFYHLTDSPLETALPMLVERALANGWRVVVRGVEPARLDWLDERLWLAPPDGFLPHGRAGGPHDADQPVLLTSGPDLPNGAACLMAVDGAALAEGDLAAVQRVCILFDGNDPAAVDRARGQWKEIVATGARAKYWAEADGRWSMKAESAG